MTNGKLIRLLVDDEPFDVRYGRLLRHERVLDFQAGTLTRRADWVSPAGQSVRVTSVRLVSFTQRSIAAINYRVEPLDGPVRVVLQSELVANEQLPPLGGDPRVAAMLEAPLEAVEHGNTGTRAGLMHQTRASGLTICATMEHRVVSDAHLYQYCETRPDLARLTVGCRLNQGQQLNLIKFVGYGWSAVRSRPALRDQVEGALLVAAESGWDALEEEQRNYLDDFWSRADVEAGRRRRDPAGGPVRHVPRAAGRGAGRGAADPGQGPVRQRLRRAHVLGCRDLCAAGAHLHHPVRGRARAALAAQHAAPGASNGPASSA